jgi:hypothetical protein
VKFTAIRRASSLRATYSKSAVTDLLEIVSEVASHPRNPRKRGQCSAGAPVCGRSCSNYQRHPGGWRINLEWHSRRIESARHSDCVGMAIGWLKLANGNPRPTFSPSLTDVRDERDEEERRFEAFSEVGGCSTFVPGMSDYYTMMAKAVGALDPNTGDARRLLYERARAVLVAELRGADPALDPSDIMAAQMLMELAIGEVEADAQRDQCALQTMDAPSMAWPPSWAANQKRFTHETLRPVLPPNW